MNNRGRAGIGAIVILAALLGVAAGVLWHKPLTRTLGLSKQDPAAGGAGDAAGVWTCGMHPQIRQETPGDCPICHMKLTPVRSGGDAAAVAGQIQIDPVAVQNMGVKTAAVTDGPLRRSIRAFGTFEEAQPSIRDINLRVSGWIRKLHASSEGMLVEQGAPLFDLYSPDLQVAVEELIAARRERDAATTKLGQPDSSAATLYQAASRRLELLGLEPAQVESLAKLDRAPDTITFTSPIMGSIIEKPIVEGASVSAGERVLRIVDHSLLWLEARIYEKDLPFVKIGAKAAALVESRPRNTYEGEIIFIHPHVDPATRTAIARMEVRNPGMALKPGMFATALIESQLAERAVLVPREAVIDSGESQVAILSLGQGKFEARDVKIGLPGDGGVIQVLSGLAEGDIVVTSGQFLLDSESRAREALAKFRNEPGGADRADKPGRRLEVTPAQHPHVDAVIRAYLAIWDAFGAEEEKLPPVDPTLLIDSARNLADASRGTELARISDRVLRDAQALRGRTTDQQREAFKPLGISIIALVDAAPPSSVVGKTLYVFYCPMAPGNWLQDTEDMANPFYATDMKTCGETLRKIETRPAEGGTRP